MSTAIVVGIFTVLGAAVGVLGTVLVERSRTKHEDETRWHNDRQNTYAAFLASLGAYRQKAMTTDGDRAALEQLREECGGYLPLIELLGTDPVQETADRAWRDTYDMGQIYDAAHADDSLSDGARTEFRRSANDRSIASVREFRDAARKELGIASPVEA